jgi:hypothetical protein
MGSQDPPNGGLADPIAQPNEFPVDSAISLPWVLPSEPEHKFAYLLAS